MAVINFHQAAPRPRAALMADTKLRAQKKGRKRAGRALFLSSAATPSAIVIGGNQICDRSRIIGDAPPAANPNECARFFPRRIIDDALFSTSTSQSSHRACDLSSRATCVHARTRRASARQMHRGNRKYSTAAKIKIRAIIAKRPSANNSGVIIGDIYYKDAIFVNRRRCRRNVTCLAHIAYR